MNYSFKREIVSSCQGYSKIITGKDSIKKIEKVYSAYNIPSNEEILAYIKSSVFLMGLTMDGAIITDQAYYFHPCHDTWANTNRFPFSEICRYFVSQADEKSSITLTDAYGEYTIWGSTLLGRNVAGAELVRFIEAVQAQLLRNYDWAPQQRMMSCQEVLRSLRDTMRIGTLSEHHLDLLHSIQRDNPSMSSEAATLEAESIARFCDESRYDQFLSGVSPDLRANLKNRYSQFLENFIQDLVAVTQEMDQQYLETVYGTLVNKRDLSDFELQILALICIRIDKASQLAAVYSSIRRRFGKEKEQQILLFQGQYYNLRMQTVFDAISKNKMPEDRQLRWKDSIGLTPLHYAIILRQEDIVEALLEKQKWQHPSPLSDGMDVYDYNVVAYCADYPNRELIFHETSDLIAAQNRSVKALRRKVWFKKRRIDVQNQTEKGLRNMIQGGKRNNAPQEKIDSYYMQLDTIINLRQETMQEILELESDIAEIEAEIASTTETGLLEAMNIAQELRMGNDPLADYLLRIFSDPDFLKHILYHSSRQCNLYCYNGFFFVAPSDIQIDLSAFNQNEYSDFHGSATHNQDNRYHEEPHTEKKRAEPVVRPFGDSWFSPEAHRDRKKLKSEFNKLAKQYHPDVSKHPLSHQIFQEILNERATILENMSDE